MTQDESSSIFHHIFVDITIVGIFMIAAVDMRKKPPSAQRDLNQKFIANVVLPLRYHVVGISHINKGTQW